MIGTAEELTARGIKVPRRTGTRSRPPWLRASCRLRSVALRSDVNPMFVRAIAAALLLLIGSTILLRFAYQRPPGMTWVDALYFTTETIATVGYGDFSFVHQQTWLRLFAIDADVRRRDSSPRSWSRSSPICCCRGASLIPPDAGGRAICATTSSSSGLGSFGVRVVSDLTAAGHDVAVIERDPNNRFLSTADDLEVPVIFGDATLRRTLEAARVDHARAVAVLTQDDMVNIETGIVLREMLGPRVMPEVVRPEVPLVLRVYDRALGAAVAQRFGFENVRSTVELAAPWFIGAAMGLQVLGTFSIGQRSFMVGGMRVAAGSELDGLQMFELSTQTRVIAITRQDAPIKLHPRRDARLCGGDTVYVVGPYRELLATLRKGQPPEQAEAQGA